MDPGIVWVCGTQVLDPRINIGWECAVYMCLGDVVLDPGVGWVCGTQFETQCVLDPRIG